MVHGQRLTIKPTLQLQVQSGSDGYGFSGRKVRVGRLPHFISSPLDFSIEPGQAWTLTASNGCGKTTFLKTLLGVLPLLGGQIDGQNAPLMLESLHHRRNIAFLGHEGGTTSRHASVNHRLQQTFHMTGAHPTRQQLDQALSLFQLKPLLQIPCVYLSRGQQQRVYLCGVMLSMRACWLLDEPFSHLDAAGQDQFKEALERHLQGGGCAILTTPSV